MGIFNDLTPDMHCTLSNARDADGVGVYATQPSATQWCAIGWIEKHGRLLDDQLLRAADAVAWQVCPQLKSLAPFYGDVARISYANDQLGWTFIEALQAAGI